MALGPNDPVWQKLYEELAVLAGDCNGTCAFVVDEGNGLWCVGVPGEVGHGSRVKRAALKPTKRNTTPLSSR